MDAVRHVGSRFFRRQKLARFLTLRYEQLEPRFVLATLLAEIGVDDFLISQDAVGEQPRPAAVFNPIEQEYLVVWRGIAGIEQTGYPPEEYEIFGQRLDAVTGTEI